MKCAECGQSFENEIGAVIQNHEPCATKHSTQPTALQQLKAEIAALEKHIGSTSFALGCKTKISYIRQRLRQLSAV
jgi:hypothetical protein